MTQIYKDIIEENIYQIVVDLIVNQEGFTILLENHNNWEFPLPENLQKADKFVMDVKNQTLEDSYVDDEGNIIINTMFGEQENSKVLEMCDIAGIMNSDGKTPMFFKPFRTEPKKPEIVYTGKKFKEPSEEDLQVSMNAFKKYNPELFVEI